MHRVRVVAIVATALSVAVGLALCVKFALPWSSAAGSGDGALCSAQPPPEAESKPVEPRIAETGSGRLPLGGTPAVAPSPVSLSSAEGTLSLEAAVKRGLVTQLSVGLARNLLSKVGSTTTVSNDLRLGLDTWKSVEEIMADYIRREQPLKQLRFERIRSITMQRIAAGHAEKYAAVQPSASHYEASEKTFREALKPRAEGEIVQELNRSIVRIMPQEDPELFEVMRQYRTMWEETAVRLEAVTSRR